MSDHETCKQQMSDLLAEVERQQETLHVAADRENDLRLEVERLRALAFPNENDQETRFLVAEVERLQRFIDSDTPGQCRDCPGGKNWEAEVQRLRAENLRLRARIEEAWDEPAEEKE